MSHYVGNQHHFFAFQNKEIDALYVAVALISVAEGVISVFVPVYLFQMGMPLWKILLFFFLRTSYYVPLLAFSIPLLRRMSDKFIIFLSIPCMIGYFVGLGALASHSWLFYALPALGALSMMFFYVGYHLDFSSSADSKHMGEEIGMSMAIIKIAYFVSPFLGGVLITTFGFGKAFLISSFVLLLAVIPLLFFPKKKVSPRLKLKQVMRSVGKRRLRKFNLSLYGYAAEGAITIVLWPLFLFLAMENYEEFGAFMSAGLLAGAIATFIAGKIADRGDGKRMIDMSSAGSALVWAGRAFIRGTSALIGSHIVGFIFRSAMISTWTREYYRHLKEERHPDAVILGVEILFHAARAMFIPVLIALAFALPAELFFPVVFAIASALTLLFLWSDN